MSANSSCAIDELLSRDTSRALIPSVSVLFEAAALRLHDTEAVSTGGFHDPPPRKLFHFLCAQLLEALHLSLDIIGLDVDMHPARMIHFLKQYADFAVQGYKLDVVFVRWIIGVLSGTSKRLAPECFRAAGLIRFTIDDDRS